MLSVKKIKMDGRIEIFIVKYNFIIFYSKFIYKLSANH